MLYKPSSARQPIRGVSEILRRRKGTAARSFCFALACQRETVQNFVRDAFSYAIGKRSSNMMAS